MLKNRYLASVITDDLRQKMVFIGGPRQVGKTTLGKTIGESFFPAYEYLSWDSRSDRHKILAEQFDPKAHLIIFDELHKYRQWKNHLKGLYDTNHDHFAMLVTGSARLDMYRRGSDSLLGRYHYYRLHPFSVAELVGTTLPTTAGGKIALAANGAAAAAFGDLLTWGGFPEPLLARDGRTLRRWQNDRLERLIKDDIRDIELVRDLSGLQILTELLPNKVGSLLSLNALREDLGVAHKTVSLWVDILERFYYHFRVYPFQTTTIKSLRKEPKLYLWDWSPLADNSKKLENMVASHLLKYTHFLVDAHGYRVELFYLRDVAGREVDFLVTLNRKPWFAVEVKTSDTTVALPLRYFSERLRVPLSYQLVGTSGIDFIERGIRVISADQFLAWLT